MSRTKMSSFAAVLALAATGQAAAEAPRVGDVQRLTAVTLSLRVGSTETETRQVVYTPPPGWYVRSHEVTCTARYGNSWRWSSEEQVRESYRLLIELAGRAQDAGLQARLASEQDRMLNELKKVRSTHHALVVEATAKGEGFLRGGGGVELTVTAELVFVGTEETLSRTLAGHRARLPEERPLELLPRSHDGSGGRLAAGGQFEDWRRNDSSAHPLPPAHAPTKANGPEGPGTGCSRDGPEVAGGHSLSELTLAPAGTLLGPTGHRGGGAGKSADEW